MKIFENPNAMLKSKYGQYQIAVLGNIIAVSAEGIASKDDIERYTKDMMDVISNFNGGKWAFLGLLHGHSVLTKDAELTLQKGIEWRAQHGMAIGCLVTGETNVEALVKSQFERIYSKTGIKLGIFKYEQEAMAWLSQEGFEV